MNQKNGRWFRWWRVIVAIVLLAVGWGIWLLLSQLPVETRGDQFVDRLSLSALLLILFASAVEAVALARDWRQSVPPFIVFLVTVCAFFAFGLEVTRNPSGSKVHFHLDVPELAVILVLFFLSELAVRLTARIENVSRKLNVLAEHIDTVSSDIAKSELVTKVHQASGLAQIFESLFQITDEKLWRHVWEQVAVKYTAIWAERTKAIPAARAVGDEQAALSLCWRTVLETYVNEEAVDILGDLSRGVTIAPQLATNQGMYLNLLSALASNASDEQSVFRKDGRVVHFLGISHVLPSYWYNWEVSPYKAQQYGPIDLYRNTVARLVASGRTHGGLEYHRLLLVDGHDPELLEEGIKPLSSLTEQTELVFIMPDQWPQPDEMRAPDREHVKRFREKFPGWRVFRGFNPDKDYYLIVSYKELCELESLNPLPVIPPLKEIRGRFVTWVHFGAIKQRIVVERLIPKFLRDLHVHSEDAEVSITTIEARRALGDLRGDHDLLMVGYREPSSNEVNWQMAITTNLRHGIETMLLHVIYEKKRLNDLAAWKKGINADVKPSSLAAAVGLAPDEL